MLYSSYSTYVSTYRNLLLFLSSRENPAFSFEVNLADDKNLELSKTQVQHTVIIITDCVKHLRLWIPIEISVRGTRIRKLHIICGDCNRQNIRLLEISI